MANQDSALQAQDVIDLIEGKIGELRKRLLDSTRRNPLINITFRPTSTSLLRVVDELPDVLRYNLTSGQAMRLKPLPALDEDLPDEQTDSFLDALYIARNEDELFLKDISAIKPADPKAEDKAFKAERDLKDRLREALELPPRQTTEGLSLAAHAENYGISPSYSLPFPEDENEDGRHQDEDIQTLMLPEKLIRTAKAILEKGKGFERETGVNVLHAAFGILDWKNPGEREKFCSPLLLLEIKIDRKQSPRGAQFFICGIEKITVNTTLAQKLHSEHRLAMPDYTGGGIEDYFREVQDSAPPGWDWTVRREIAIGIFPSSKIAMYHDLDPKKRDLAQNPIVARLLATTGVGDGSYAEVYETDAPDIARKVPHLVMDADASQYSALVDVADGKSLAIEGPPGSGKSQSIVNLIAAAMADGKKVLFVAEKLTALDVVKNRLEAANLGAFILPLQAGKGTAEHVYESLEARIKLGRGSSRSGDDFDSRQTALERRRAILQNYLDALESEFGSTGMTVFDVIGHGIATSDIRDGLPRDVKRIRIAGSESFGPTMIESLISDADGFAQRLGKINRMPVIWIEAQATIQSREDAEDICDLISSLTETLTDFDLDLRSSALSPLLSTDVFSVDFTDVTGLLDGFAAQGDRADASLIEKLMNPTLRRTVYDFCGQIQERQACRARLARHLADLESWNLDERLTAALAFAEQNGGAIAPETHAAAIVNLDSMRDSARRALAIAQTLPRQWTDTSLAERQVQAREILAFPSHCAELRVADPDGQTNSLATEIQTRATTLVTELACIGQALPTAGTHNPSEIRAAAETIRNSGTLRFLSRPYKMARNLYANTLGGNGADDRTVMVSRLEAYAAWLDDKIAFETDNRFRTSFGATFSGLSSNLTEINEIAAFQDCIRGACGFDTKLCMDLQTGDLGPLRAFANGPQMPDQTLAALANSLDDISRARSEEEHRLNEGRAHIALFRDRSSISIEELAGIAKEKEREITLDDLIDTSNAADILGDRFNGVGTSLDALMAECSLAAVIAEAPDTSAAMNVLRSGNSTSLLAEAKAFLKRRTSIESQVAEIVRTLKLDQATFTLNHFFERKSDLNVAAADPSSLMERARLHRAEQALRDQGFDTLIDWVMQERDTFDSTRLSGIVRSVIAKAQADRAFEIHRDALDGYGGEEFDRIRAEIANKDRQLIEMSRDVIHNRLLIEAQPPSGNSIGLKSTFSNMSLIVNEIHKKRNRVGVRELTRRAGAALLELKPCWMMSPLAVSQYLHDGLTFDLVVIDEASQMTPENAIGALSRARQAAIVGDTKQLPPTSFFQKMLDESDTDEDLREDAESVLDMANIAFMPVRQLRWHYRSRHSGLIQFSNTWMYKGELTIFPSAQENDPDLGVHLVEVEGVYKGRTNEVEARAIVAAAVRHMTTNPGLSLGICTMNTDQKDLILEEFERERDRNSHVQAYVRRWEEENDSLEEFFIKNLETIQGDERDVMFISTLYGPEIAGGRPHQRFGPINSSHGHRRLNVLFTRAKRKIVTFTSLKPSDILINEGQNIGVKMFRAWLEYSKTGYIAEESGPRGTPDSPFEDFVIRRIEALGYQAVPQVGAAGYRIDIGVRHSSWPYGYILGVECDGAAYHSSKSSRDRDRLRQEVLEGLQWKLHRIWSTDWFRNPQAECDVLKEVMEQALALAIAKGRKHQPEEPMQNTAVVNEKDFGGAVQAEANAAVDPGAVGQKPVLEAVPESARKSKPERPLLDDDLFSRIELTASTPGDLRQLRQVAASLDPIIKLGSKVKIEHLSEGGRKMAFTLVSGANNPDQGKVGDHTPLGKALLDAQVGDEVEYLVGVHIKEVRVLHVE